MEEENDIDQLFKRGLNDPDIPFNELDWRKMERKLDAQKKRRVIPMWLVTAGGIAAVLTILLSWYFMTSVPAEKNDKKDLLTGSGAKQQSLSDQKASAIDSPVIVQPPADYVFNGIEKPSPVSPIEKQVMKFPEQTSLYAAPFRGPLKTGIQQESITALVLPGIKSVAQETDSSLLAKKAYALANSKDPLERIDPIEIARNIKRKMENDLAQKHNLILSAMAAPDISSANSSSSTKVSSNLGMLATYAFTPKISVTSGAVYANKLYNYGYTSQSTGNNWEVEANCNVLDIPVNVNYRVLDKKRLSVSINTGLSSYFMLKEKYDYTTGQPGPDQRTTTVNINNENQHIFGIANVSVTFDHQISRNLSVGVQPFAKLPLTGIGFTDANLKSTGIAFSLNIGLFSTKKPGKYAANRY